MRLQGRTGSITPRRLLALGVSGGLLPCPSALVVMLGAIALHRTALRAGAGDRVQPGAGGTLTGVGLLVLYARRFVDRVPSSRRLFSAAADRERRAWSPRSARC